MEVQTNLSHPIQAFMISQWISTSSFYEYDHLVELHLFVENIYELKQDCYSVTGSMGFQPWEFTTSVKINRRVENDELVFYARIV